MLAHLRSCFRALLDGRNRRVLRADSTCRRFRPQLDCLEQRDAPAIITVTNNQDNGNNVFPIAGSLRNAILWANLVSQGPDTIVFGAINNGPVIIQPVSPLPAVTEQITIDGKAPDAAKNQIIQLDGSKAGANANGLEIQAGNSIINKLVIVRFGGAGIAIIAANTNVVTGNTIGIDSADQLAANFQGMSISNSVGNTVGGNTAEARNVISGNTNSGILISEAKVPDDSQSNKIVGNYIGTNKDGRSGGVGNGVGITILNGTRTTVGGMNEGERNIVSDNASHGVRIVGGDTNYINGNYIGVDVDGAKLGNGSAGAAGSGVQIESSDDNWIGKGGTVDKNGVIQSASNVISGNLEYGVSIQDGHENKVKGNFIGTDTAGSAATDKFGKSFANNKGGVLIIQGALGNIVGGAAAAERNIISNNAGDGVRIDNAILNQVLWNNIGTNKAGSQAPGDALPNTGDGVRVMNGAAENLVKESKIAFNKGAGINSQGAGAKNRFSDPNHIFSNAGFGIIVGGTETEVSDNEIQSNGLGGIQVVEGVDHMISSNVISANTGSGVRIEAGSTIGLVQNQVTYNAGSGFYIANATNVSIIDNSVTQNSDKDLRMVSGNAIADGIYGLFGTAEQTGGTVEIGGINWGESKLTVQANYDVIGGILTIFRFRQLAVSELAVKPQGVFNHSGVVTGNVRNEGRMFVQPQVLYDTAEINGNFTQTLTGFLNFNVLGTQQAGFLQVSGLASLAGTLELTGSAAVDAFFALIGYGTVSGGFDNYVLPPGNWIPVWLPDTFGMRRVA